MYYFNQINSGKIVQKCQLCFNILVLYLMLLVMGRKIKSDDEGQEQVVADAQDTQIVDEMEDSQSSASATSNRVTTPPPITPCGRLTPGKKGCIYGPNKIDAIEEKLLTAEPGAPKKKKEKQVWFY